ncbi:Histidine kinase-, DNA gyrase B-, and HSP90-like ATPase [Andreprevotia lacus DSM 23236]|jgi:signal transduction histidine kinase|uniref:histidine kinase n=1 Tax=Andreprevotia lacus DSM 23236 TaxID=1121001 RepID=A0A1W1XD07_9NEIS|nr:HAMP domain-containing sensor histidine kinase [Andreprevotia lacus]SMC21742.1 Histidine kinase-, DNA gyrase B-, and HSP90-like ATPase [Andreprevotia lacus DSM 23236]
MSDAPPPLVDALLQALMQRDGQALVGNLVPGFAHEVSTPIGNCVTVSSTLADKTRAVAASLQEKSLKQSQLVAYLADAVDAATLLERNLLLAHELISRFRQTTLDQAGALRRRFDLEETLHEYAALLRHRLKKTPYELQLDLPSHVEFDSYPGALQQVIDHLVSNAQQHAFAGRSIGLIKISGQASADSATLDIDDNGIGIAPEHLPHLFALNVATVPGQALRLGLFRVHELVTKVLGGNIKVSSSPDAGTRIQIKLPRMAPPEHAA